MKKQSKHIIYKYGSKHQKKAVASGEGYTHQRTVVFYYMPFGTIRHCLIWACIALSKININCETIYISNQKRTLSLLH